MNLMSLTKEELCEEIIKLNGYLAQMLEEYKYGISLHPDTVVALEIVFPKETTRKQVLGRIFENAQSELDDLIRMRYYASVSGAMRYDSSQEAAIVGTRAQLRYI